MVLVFLLSQLQKNYRKINTYPPLTQGMKVSKTPHPVSLGLHLGELVLSTSTSGLAFLSFHYPETSSDISFPPHDR